VDPLVVYVYNDGLARLATKVRLHDMTIHAVIKIQDQWAAEQRLLAILVFAHMYVWRALMYACLQKYKRPRKANLRHSTMHLTNYAVNKASKVSLTPLTLI
jgi:hypothetical protein